MTGLSIVIPALNEADGIVGILEALAPLRARGTEVIVADGGSTDETAALARPLADKVIEASRGRAYQMNAGAAHARGHVLLFLHADTELPAAADRVLMRRLPASGEAWGRFNVTIAGTHWAFPVIAALMNWRSRVSGIATGDHAIFVSRSLFDRVGGFPPIPLMEDVALTRMLRRYGPPLALRERVSTSARRWEKHGVFRTIWLMWRLRFAYWRGAEPEGLLALYAPHKP